MYMYPLHCTSHSHDDNDDEGDDDDNISADDDYVEGFKFGLSFVIR